MWWSLALAMLVAGCAVVLWRLRFPEAVTDNAEQLMAANRALYLEKIAQLQQQRDSGELDQARYGALEVEYQRQFLADAAVTERASSSGRGRSLLWGCALLLPLVALSIYHHIGASSELTLKRLLEERAAIVQEQGASQAAYDATDRVLSAMASLAEKQPDNPLYPVLIARLKTDQGQYAQAVPYYLKATVLLPEDGALLAEYAQVLFFAAGNTMTDQVRELAGHALQLAPMNQTALSLAGIASFQGEEYQRAIDYWQRALALLPEGTPSRQPLETGITAARQRLGSDHRAQEGADTQRSLVIDVPAPEANLPGNTVVFVYARAWQGSPMPLAIRKLQVADLPARVVLTEAMAMAPQASLATANQVEVVARISLAGTPVPAAGDWQASVGPETVEKGVNEVTLGAFSQIEQ